MPKLKQELSCELHMVIEVRDECRKKSRQRERIPLLYIVNAVNRMKKEIMHAN